MTFGRLTQRVGRIVGATIAGAGLMLGIGCGQLLSIDCDMSFEVVSAGGTGTLHKYEYSLGCTHSVEGRVTATWDARTHVAQEKLKGPQGTVTAEWVCLYDPWVRLDGYAEFRCSQSDRKANLTVDNGTLYALMASPPTAYPYSAHVLSGPDRLALARKLDEALHPRPTPAPVLSPAPTPGTCTASACLVKPEEKPASASLAAPGNLTGELTSGRTRIVLAWSDVNGETSYELRGSNEDSGLFFTKTLPAGTTTYVDEIGPNQSGAFVYELKACDATGCGSPVTVVVRL